VSKERRLKEKIFHEMAEYWINVGYLTLVFAAFTWYRRFGKAVKGARLSTRELKEEQKVTPQCL
jgi:hypothetical protein